MEGDFHSYLAFQILTVIIAVYVGVAMAAYIIAFLCMCCIIPLQDRVERREMRKLRELRRRRIRRTVREFDVLEPIGEVSGEGVSTTVVKRETRVKFADDNGEQENATNVGVNVNENADSCDSPEVCAKVEREIVVELNRAENGDADSQSKAVLTKEKAEGHAGAETKSKEGEGERSVQDREIDLEANRVIEPGVGAERDIEKGELKICVTEINEKAEIKADKARDAETVENVEEDSHKTTKPDKDTPAKAETKAEEVADKNKEEVVIEAGQEVGQTVNVNIIDEKAERKAGNGAEAQIEAQIEEDANTNEEAEKQVDEKDG